MGVAEANRRLSEDGWSQGLEILGYALPIPFGLRGLLLVLAGFLVRPKARARE